MDPVARKKEARLRFLNAVYEATDGNEHKIVSVWDLADKIGMNREEADSALQFLVGEHLLAHRAMGGFIGITHFGVSQVEDALSHPESSTAYFPPAINILHIGTVTNSQIQQGSHESSQAQTNASDAELVKAVAGLAARIAEALPSIGLEKGQMEELEAHLAILRTQASASAPRRSLLKEVASSIQHILEQAAGNLVATGLLNHVAIFAGLLAR